MLDQVILRSALGRADPNVHYEWNPLWQLSDVQKCNGGNTNTVTNTSITNQINKFVGTTATSSNAASTHINFQGVIIRLGLNYHFNFL